MAADTFRLVLSFALVLFASGAVQRVHADQELTSPVYIDYNENLDVTNILELVSAGDRTLEATVTVYDPTGFVANRVEVSLEPGAQQDLIINDLVSSVIGDIYGVVKVDYNSGRAKIAGRMSYYRFSPDGSYSFAFSRPLQKPLSGTSYGISNSFDPSGRGYLVPNWLQVTNLSASEKTFTVRLYDVNGALLRTEALSLGSNERFDVSGGHELGEGLYLAEVVPEDSSVEYLSAISRYASNNLPGFSLRDFSFAVSLDTRAGGTDTQLVYLSNEEERGDTCFDVQNWLELVNTSAAEATATVTFYGEDGTTLDTSNVTLGGRSQFHLNASAVLNLSGNTKGWATIEGSTPGAFVAQSSVYYLACRGNELQTAYTIPVLSPIKNPLFGSFNRFLNQENFLIILNNDPRPLSTELTLSTLTSEGLQELFSETVSTTRQGLSRIALNDEMFGTSEDTFGSVSIDASNGFDFVAYLLRVRSAENGGIEFVNPTQVR